MFSLIWIYTRTSDTTPVIVMGIFQTWSQYSISNALKALLDLWVE